MKEAAKRNMISVERNMGYAKTWKDDALIMVNNASMLLNDEKYSSDDEADFECKKYVNDVNKKVTYVHTKFNEANDTVQKAKATVDATVGGPPILQQPSYESKPPPSFYDLTTPPPQLPTHTPPGAPAAPAGLGAAAAAAAGPTTEGESRVGGARLRTKYSRKRKYRLSGKNYKQTLKRLNKKHKTHKNKQSNCKRTHTRTRK